MNSQANMSSWVSLSGGSFFLGVLREGVIIDTRVAVKHFQGGPCVELELSRR